MTDLLVCRLERCYCQPAGLASCRRGTTVVAPRAWLDGRGTAVLAVPGNRCGRNARAERTRAAVVPRTPRSACHPERSPVKDLHLLLRRLARPSVLAEEPIGSFFRPSS